MSKCYRISPEIKKYINVFTNVYVRKEKNWHLYMNETGSTEEKEGNPRENESALISLHH